MNRSKAKIFLADERGLNETTWLRSWNTFVFGNYNDENKKPFSDLYVFNDDTLAGGHSLKMLVEETTRIIILPVAGAVNYKDSVGNDSLIAAGQSLSILVMKGTVIELINPFSEDPVNFLQLWIRDNGQLPIANSQVVTYADVNTHLNKLEKIGMDQDEHSIFIGKFSGRGETVYSLEKDKSVFLFVIEGAFEAEGKLLHPRDGLVLWEINEIEIEALSEGAILLLIDSPLKEELK